MFYNFYTVFYTSAVISLVSRLALCERTTERPSLTHHCTGIVAPDRPPTVPVFPEVLLLHEFLFVVIWNKNANTQYNVNPIELGAKPGILKVLKCTLPAPQRGNGVFLGVLFVSLCVSNLTGNLLFRI